MLTTQYKDLLDRLRAGQFDPSEVTAIEQLSARSFAQELTASHSVIFQQRTVKQKWEVGLARKVRYELAFTGRGGANIPNVVISTVLRDCVLLSGYDDSLSEISLVSNVRVWRIRRPVRGLAVRIGRGYKLDRTPDGWQLDPLKPTTAKLAEGLLLARGWQFGVLSPLKSTP